VFAGIPGPVTAYATSTGGAIVGYTPPTASDDLDGQRPVSCTPASGSPFPPGQTTVTCTASDTRGNSNTARFVIWVQYEAPTDGSFFLKPIRADGSSVFRVGRPVPVKFKLAGASQDITDLQSRLVVTKISDECRGTADDESDEDGDETDFLFKFRKGKGIYAYRWKTRDESRGTYRLRAELGDGVVHEVNVSLKVRR
jgi:HYR domain